MMGHLFSSTLALLLLFGAKSVNAQGVYDCPAEEYDIKWDYTPGSPKGPENWGTLKTKWITCKNGTRQSPINLSNPRVRFNSQPLGRNYNPGNATLENSGHDISVYWNIGDVGSIYINGTEYHLLEFHWHTPSEHTVNGTRYDMELHMVHRSLDNITAVVGVLYRIGLFPDPFLASLRGSITTLIDRPETCLPLGIIDPNDVQIESPDYYRYIGSLTTPPCSEPVIWTVNTLVKNVTRDQINLLKEAVLDYAEENARPLQPQNNRDIDLYLAL